MWFSAEQGRNKETRERLRGAEAERAGRIKGSLSLVGLETAPGSGPKWPIAKCQHVRPPLAFVAAAPHPTPPHPTSLKAKGSQGLVWLGPEPAHVGAFPARTCHQRRMHHVTGPRPPKRQDAASERPTVDCVARFSGAGPRGRHPAIQVTRGVNAAKRLSEALFESRSGVMSCVCPHKAQCGSI